MVSIIINTPPYHPITILLASTIVRKATLTTLTILVLIKMVGDIQFYKYPLHRTNQEDINYFYILYLYK